jgi:hypothetical protein
MDPAPGKCYATVSGLDIAVFKDFDAVHACLSGGTEHWPSMRSLGPGLIPHVIELTFLCLLDAARLLVPTKQGPRVQGSLRSHEREALEC